MFSSHKHSFHFRHEILSLFEDINNKYFSKTVFSVFCSISTSVSFLFSGWFWSFRVEGFPNTTQILGCLTLFKSEYLKQGGGSVRVDRSY